MTTLGTLLRQARKAESRNNGRGEYNQANVAKRAEISTSTLSKYENDTVRNPQQATVEAIAAALNCDETETAGLLQALTAQQKARAELPQLHEELAQAEAAGDGKAHAVALTNLAHGYRRAADLAQAETLFEQSLAQNREIDNAEGVNANLAYLGLLYLEQDALEKGIEFLQQARNGFAALENQQWVQQIDAVMYSKIQEQMQAQGLTSAQQATPPQQTELPGPREMVLMVKAALSGNEQARDTVGPMCVQLSQATNPALAALGRGLLEVLQGLNPAQALAQVPAALRDKALIDLRSKPQGATPTLKDIVGLVKAARDGDAAAISPARAICKQLAGVDNKLISTLARGLAQVLDGTDPVIALAALPDDFRAQVVADLR